MICDRTCGSWAFVDGVRVCRWPVRVFVCSCDRGRGMHGIVMFSCVVVHEHGRQTVPRPCLLPVRMDTVRW